MAHPSPQERQIPLGRQGVRHMSKGRHLRAQQHHIVWHAGRRAASVASCRRRRAGILSAEAKEGDAAPVSNKGTYLLEEDITHKLAHGHCLAVALGAGVDLLQAQGEARL